MFIMHDVNIMQRTEVASKQLSFHMLCSCVSLPSCHIKPRQSLLGQVASQCLYAPHLVSVQLDFLLHSVEGGALVVTILSEVLRFLSLRQCMA